MMQALYLRVSTDKQDTDNQLLALTQLYPEGVVVSETASGVGARVELEKLCLDLSSGDTLVVYAIDRLGRSSIEILQRIQALIGRGVKIHSLREGWLDSSPSGKFLVAVLAAAAELERNLISERTKAGLARARSQGKQIGAKPLGREAEVLHLHSGGMNQRQIARTLGVSLGYVNKRVRGY
jgi:putative DNA-invertase from lambdoid prophage Rac